MHRRGNEFELQRLIGNLQFVDVKGQTLYGRIPKIGSEIEKTILNKLFNYTKLGSSYQRLQGVQSYIGLQEGDISKS